MAAADHGERLTVAAASSAEPIPRVIPRRRDATALVVLAVACATGVVLRALVLAAGVLARFLNTDVLYSVMVYRDLVVDHYPLRGWSFAAAPSFVPDLAAVVTALALTGDVGLGLTVWVVFLLVALGLAFSAVLRAAGATRAVACAHGFAGVLALAALIPTGHGLLLEFVLPCHHAGAVLMGCVLLALWLGGLRASSMGRAAMLFAVGAVATASDRIVVAQFVVPILVTTAILYAARLLGRRPTVVTGLALGAAIVAGTAAVPLLRAVGVLDGGKLPFYLAQNLRLPPRAAWPQLWALVRESGPFVPVIVGWLAVCGATLADRAVRRPPLAHPALAFLALAVFSLVSAVTTLVPVLLVPPENYWATRHLAPLYAVSVLGLAATLARAGGRRRVGRAVLVVVVVAGLVRTVPPALALDVARLAHPYPDRVRELDELAARYGLHDGYSDYWNAKVATALSRRGLRVNAVTPELTQLVLVSNPAWFAASRGGAPGYPRYTFIMIARLSPPLVLERFGEPVLRQATGFGEIWIYDREADVGFRNLLRGAVDGPTSVVRRGFPAWELATFEPDGTPVDAPGTVAVPADEGLTAPFRCPEPCDVLELSADADDEYALDVQVEGEPTRRVAVGAGRAPGLQSRFVRIAPPVRGRVLLTIRRVGSLGRYRLGHVFLYRDPFGG